MSLITLLLGKRKKIIRKLEETGATSENNAKTLEEIGIYGYSDVISKLLQDKVLVKTKDDKYYINK